MTNGGTYANNIWSITNIEGFKLAPTYNPTNSTPTNNDGVFIRDALGESYCNSSNTYY